MQYGDMNIVVQELERYLGFNPANENVTTPFLPELNLADTLMAGKELAVNQRDDYFICGTRYTLSLWLSVSADLIFC